MGHYYRERHETPVANTTSDNLQGLGTGTPDPDGDDPNATTSAIEAAEAAGLDLNTITGTGKDGRITKADVEAATDNT